jgi:hypothetical protein
LLPSVKQLKAVYRAYNKALFGDKLPEIPILVRDMRKLKLRGWFGYKKDLSPKCIIIDHKQDDLWPQILLHEMTHLYYTSILKRRQTEPHPPGFLRILKSKYKKLGFSLLPEEKS